MVSINVYNQKGNYDNAKIAIGNKYLIHFFIEECIVFKPKNLSRNAIFKIILLLNATNSSIQF